jgi:hypothetical protein
MPTRPLRVGVQLPEVEREIRWPEIVDMARAAEATGFDSIWIGDHLLYRYADGSTRGPWEAWTLLSALAAATSTVRLGPLVACTAFHAPPMLAKMATTVDEISGGRLVLGLGAGWNETEFAAFGEPAREHLHPREGEPGRQRHSDCGIYRLRAQQPSGRRAGGCDSCPRSESRAVRDHRRTAGPDNRHLSRIDAGLFQ